MKNTTLIAILCLVLASLAAAIPKRYLFSTTSIDSVAPTTLGTNLLAQGTPTAARSVLLITNATGLEATAANLTTVSNAQATTAANLTTVSTTVTNHSNTLATNTALLNGTNTFVGSNVFTNIVNLAGPIFVRGLTNLPAQIALVTNGVGLISQVACDTDIITHCAVSNGFRLTNPILDCRLPAMGPNQRLTVTFYQVVTNSNIGSTDFFAYGGEGTNYLSGTTGPGNTGTLGSNGYYVLTTGAIIPFITWGSPTNQYGQGPYPFSTSAQPGNRVDTSTNGWRLMVGIACQNNPVNLNTYTNYTCLKVVVTYSDLF